MIIDGLRILIPGYIALSAGVIGVIALYEIYERVGIVGTFIFLPAVSLLLGVYAIFLVVGLKKAVMGTFKPVIVPLWSMYVWLNEMVNGAYESVMAPAIAPFLGTPFIATFLRMIGCKIGRHAYIDTTLFSEFDLVEIADYATLNMGAVIQNHLFEDRVMKSSYLKIGEGCSVGNMGVVLYDSVMEAGSVLGPLSLLMKGETLAAGSRNHGIPTVSVAAIEPEAPYVRESLEFHNVVGRGLRTQLGAQVGIKPRPAARDRGRPRVARALEQIKEES
jgi:non-ribosomal peptide synthetase-like protein